MKIIRTVVALIFLVFAAGLAKADQVDPTIKTGGGGGGGGGGAIPLQEAPAGIITLDFTIETPSGSSPYTSPCILTQGTIVTTVPDCVFENDITQSGYGLTLVALTFDAPTINPSTVTCGFFSGSPFGDCSVGPLSGGGAVVEFTDGSIAFHQNFAVHFADFPQDFSFATQATAVPEPVTLTLLLGGVGAVLLRRRSSGRIKTRTTEALRH